MSNYYSTSSYYMDGDEIKENEQNDSSQWLEIVHRYVKSLKFGTVQITVHDSVVTQIEKTEKTRLDNPRAQINNKTQRKLTGKPEVPNK